MIPAKLKNMNLSVDGQGYKGEVMEVIPPKITSKLQDYRAGGMHAALDIDLGLEKLEVEVKYGGFMRHIFAGLGSHIVDGTYHRYVGAYQSDDTGEYTKVELIMLGRYSEVDMGSSKVGDDTENMSKSTLAYYQLRIDDVEVLTIDILNHVYRVDGVDRLAEERAILGI